MADDDVIFDLLRRLDDLGARCTPTPGGRLCLDSPRELSADLLAEVREHRDEVVVLLRSMERGLALAQARADVGGRPSGCRLARREGRVPRLDRLLGRARHPGSLRSARPPAP